MHARNPSIRPAATPFGLFVLLAATVVYGLFGGLFLGIMSDIFYLLVLFPMGVGFGIGMGLAYLIRRYTIRMPRLAIGCAAAAGLLAIFMLHWTSYQKFMQEAGETIRRELAQIGASELSGDTIHNMTNVVLEDEVGMTGLPGYMALSAKEGVTVGRSAFFKLTGPLAWGVWALELGLVIYFATKVAGEEARRASCAWCGAWMAGGRLLGSVPARQADEFLALARGGELRAASGLLRDESLPPGSLDVYLESCVSCAQGDARLSVNRSEMIDGKPVSGEIFALPLTADAAGQIAAAVA